MNLHKGAALTAQKFPLPMTATRVIASVCKCMNATHILKKASDEEARGEGRSNDGKKSKMRRSRKDSLYCTITRKMSFQGSTKNLYRDSQTLFYTSILAFLPTKKTLGKLCIHPV